MRANAQLALILRCVEYDIAEAVDKAKQEIKAMCERERRSLGQTVRWSQWRIGK